MTDTTWLLIAAGLLAVFGTALLSGAVFLGRGRRLLTELGEARRERDVAQAAAAKLQAQRDVAYESRRVLQHSHGATVQELARVKRDLARAVWQLTWDKDRIRRLVVSNECMQSAVVSLSGQLTDAHAQLARTNQQVETCIGWLATDLQLRVDRGER